MPNPWVADLEFRFGSLDAEVLKLVESTMPFHKFLTSHCYSLSGTENIDHDCWHLISAKDVDEKGWPVGHSIVSDDECCCSPVILHQEILDGTLWVLHRKLCKPA